MIHQLVMPLQVIQTSNKANSALLKTSRSESSTSLGSKSSVRSVSTSSSTNKPKRPLSAYNLFFQVEREHIVKNGVESSIPSQYSQDEVARMSQWHKVRPRRPHRKNKGMKLGFHELARVISVRWRDLSQADRQIFLNQAKLEKEQYNLRIAEWEQQHQQEQQQAAVDYPKQPDDMQLEDLLKVNALTAMELPANGSSNEDSNESLHSSLSSFESLESLDQMIDDVLEMDIFQTGLEDKDEVAVVMASESVSNEIEVEIEPFSSPATVASQTNGGANNESSLFETAEELQLLLSVTTFHRSVFGNSSRSHAMGNDDLMQSLTEQDLDTLFDDEES